MVTPDQPWLDGYCVEKGTIRQFVAMPLGGGYTAEEQITGEAVHGGLQIVAYPIKAAVYRKLYGQRDQAIYSMSISRARVDFLRRVRHGPRPRRPNEAGNLRRSPRLRRVGHESE